MFPDSFRAANQKIQERADKMREDDHQNPDDLVIALARLLGDAIHQHPNPKGKEQDAERENDEGKTKHNSQDG